MEEVLRRIKFRKYAGVKIKGDVCQPGVEPTASHLVRAMWLTSMVESGGLYGTVQNFDGAGMTASITQAIAVYPKELLTEDENAADDQGPLWKLLKRIQDAAATHTDDDFRSLWINFVEALFDADWYLSPDATLRHVIGRDKGLLVLGRDIREEFTGAADGCMPEKGEGRDCAEKWVMRFHELFSYPATFGIQQAFGVEHFVKRAERTRLRFSKTYPSFNIQAALYGITSFNHISSVNLPLESGALDLACCMFWNYNVNAPGRALKILCRTVDKFDLPGIRYTTDTWAKHLINELGNDKYGRFDDDIKNGRYQRTRKYAMKVWPRNLFVGGGTVIMPKDLED